jgi:DNA (cytosine-5)-methyltransferase 1
MTLTVGSLFSGIGGIDLGLERAGMEVRWQVEIDEWCRRVLTKHWPDVPKYGDITTLTGEELAPVDLLCGGFPCQPVSVAGRRLGDADDRWLWPEFIRVVRLVRPTWVLVENVPGLRSAASGRLFGGILADLAACGFDAEWDCIPASAVGAHHQRDRLWLVATHTASLRRQRGCADERWRERQEVERSELPRGHGTYGDVAHTNDAGCEEQRWPLSVGTQLRSVERCRSTDVADADERRRHGRTGQFGQGRWREPADCGWWEPESPFRGVVDGVPRRVDRLRGLGNSVVPQVVEHVGRMIVSAATAGIPTHV